MKHIATRLAAAFAAVLSIVTAAHAGPALDRIRQNGSVTIGYRGSSVPFSYILDDGRPVGYAIDLCQHLVRAIATATGKKTLGVKYVEVTTKTRIPAIVDGSADLDCESTTNSAERRKLVAFSIPHYITGSRYAVLANSPIAVLSDFHGKKLVSTVDTSPLKSVKAANKLYLLGIDIVEAPDHYAALEQVHGRKADGFVMDEVLLAGMIATQPDPTQFKIVGKYLTIEPLGIMLQLGDPELLKIVNDEMRRLIYSGEAAALHDRWFTKPIPPSGRSMALPMPNLLRDYWRYPMEWKD